MSRYVIYKSTRLPWLVSYSGATWDIAGIRDQYRETYYDKATAEALAKKLSAANPVGFSVASVEIIRKRT